MILEHKAELAGRVKLQISGGERGTIDYPWQDNMILDQGLSRLASSNSNSNHGQFMLFCFGIGSSSQTVSPTDTDLIQPIYRLFDFGAQTYGWDEAGGYGWSRNIKTFPRGVAAGNISELTTGSSAVEGNAFARALVRDESGNPTTITVLSDEVLTMTWEVRRWWIPKDPHVINYTIDGASHSTTVTYLPISSMDKSQDGLGSGGTGGFGGALVATNTGEQAVHFAESSGNPQIVASNSPRGIPGNNTYSVGWAFPFNANYATFTPPIPKTAGFKCDIWWRLTLARREP